MKYIILKAQEAREFEDLGGLTITKQFKPEPPYIEGAVLEQTDGGNWRLVDDTGRPIEGEDGAADVFVPPVQSGDVVYIREPWIRLKNPDGSPSDRIRLAADSVVSEGQQACKWSSPVSMPEDAARRFALVGAVEPLYNENIIIWQITLHAITKETAQEAEASGLPVGEGSDCDTYDGDMSKEDYERMAAAIDIDADRERLTEVQDRIIWLAYCRHGIEVALKSGKVEAEQRKEFFDAGMTLAEEQKERIDEEAELRRALEDAGVLVLTTEGRAKERLEAMPAVSKLRKQTRKRGYWKTLTGRTKSSRLTSWNSAHILTPSQRQRASRQQTALNPQTIQMTRKTRRKKTRKTGLYLS